MRLLDSDLKLHNGSRVAVIGGGPAGAFFSYFLLAMTERICLDVKEAMKKVPKTATRHQEIGDAGWKGIALRPLSQ